MTTTTCPSCVLPECGLIAGGAGCICPACKPEYGAAYAAAWETMRPALDILAGTDEKHVTWGLAIPTRPGNRPCIEIGADVEITRDTEWAVTRWIDTTRPGHQPGIWEPLDLYRGPDPADAVHAALHG